jgi:Protein of unknown function (DUF2911)
VLRCGSLLALVAIGCAQPRDPPETGGFVTRLGNDTIGVERFTRTRDSIVGEFLFRSPTTSRQSYVIHTTPDGAVTLYSIQLYESAKPGAKKTFRYDADFRGDSVHIMRSGGGPSRRMRTMPNLPGSVPVYEPAFAEYESPIQRALAAHGQAVPVAAFYLDLTFGGTAKQTAPDTVLISTSVGTIRAHIDSAGRLLDAKSPGATLQALVTRVPPPDIDAYAVAFDARDSAGKGLGYMSPRDAVHATVGPMHVVIDYGRPSKRGRTIFGGVVPYNTIWRTGANAATAFKIDRDAMLGSARVPAGEYTLFSLPASDAWTLVVSKKTHEWGTEYDSTMDLARIPMRVTTTSAPVEMFTISVDPKGVLSFAWDTRQGSLRLSSLR